MSRHRTWRAAIGAAGVLVLPIAACGTSPARIDAASLAAMDDAQIAELLVDPAVLLNAIDAQAEGLVVECMAAAGHVYRPTVAQLPLGEPPPAEGYGVVVGGATVTDANAAHLEGLSEAERASWLSALSGAGDRPGCEHAGDQRRAELQPLVTAYVDATRTLEDDPVVRAAVDATTEAWRTCMAARGFEGFDGTPAASIAAEVEAFADASAQSTALDDVVADNMQDIAAAADSAATEVAESAEAAPEAPQSDALSEASIELEAVADDAEAISGQPTTDEGFVRSGEAMEAAETAMVVSDSTSETLEETAGAPAASEASDALDDLDTEIEEFYAEFTDAANQGAADDSAVLDAIAEDELTTSAADFACRDSAGAGASGELIRQRTVEQLTGFVAAHRTQLLEVLS